MKKNNLIDAFNPECPQCQVTISKIEKWIDHVGVTPGMAVRYQRLLDFVLSLSMENRSDDSSIEYVSYCAKNILKELNL